MSIVIYIIKKLNGSQSATIDEVFKNSNRKTLEINHFTLPDTSHYTITQEGGRHRDIPESVRSYDRHNRGDYFCHVCMMSVSNMRSNTILRYACLNNNFQDDYLHLPRGEGLTILLNHRTLCDICLSKSF